MKFSERRNWLHEFMNTVTSQESLKIQVPKESANLLQGEEIKEDNNTILDVYMNEFS